MSRSYYYLVAGLPDIIPDGGKKTVSIQDFIDETIEQVHPDDAQLLSLARLPADNANLLALLEKRDADFKAGGSFSREALAEQIKNPDDTIPAYMQLFIDAFKESRQLIPDISIENQLAWVFYDEVCGHGNEFVSQWFSFDRDMRNVLAGLECRAASGRGQALERPFMLQRAIIGDNEIAQTILKSNAADFSLSGQFQWVEKILSVGREDVVGYEKNLDAIRWDMLNECTALTHFQIETVLAFVIKLGIVERWQALDEKAGKEIFERLIKELTSSFMTKEAA